ncbi:DUF6122 family protein [Flavobacteriaceae bacterium]|nr:DUF6122 family protein [Flavobacteriaceae bacterium]
MLQSIVHYGLHFLLPVAIAYIFYRPSWIRIALILLATMAVDLDHLLSQPIFDATRCSIGYHLLHQPLAIICYAILLLFPRARLVSIGLLLHMLTDKIDCIWMGV